MKNDKSIRTCVDNERGSAFVLMLLVFCVVLVLGIGVLGAAMTNTRMSEADRDYQSVFYIAESGRDTQVAHIQDVITQKSAGSTCADDLFSAMDQFFKANYPVTVRDFKSQFGDMPQAVVRIEGIKDRPADCDSHTYTLISEGNVGGIRRQVASKVQITWVENENDTFNPDVALFTMQGVELTGSSRIPGSAGTNAAGAGDIDFGWSTSISGNLYIPPDVDSESLITTQCPNDTDNIGGSILSLQEERTYPLPPYPEIPNLPLRDNVSLSDNYPNHTIDEDGYYQKIESNSHALTIDVGSGIRRLVVDEFLFGGDPNTCVNIIGSGLLEMYVTDTFKLEGDSRFNPGGDKDSVMLYYSGVQPFSVAGTTLFQGNVYVKSADVDILGSGGLAGHIVTGGTSVDISGNAAAHVRVIYAPNAYVRLDGSGHATGAVIAKSCSLIGDTYITYQADAGAGGIPIDGFGAKGEVQFDVTKPIELDY